MWWLKQSGGVPHVSLPRFMVQVWKVAIDDAIDKWMQRLKKSAENADDCMRVENADDCMSTEEALAAGISRLAYDSLGNVQLFNRDMFVAMTHGQCALCKKAWAGAVRVHTHTDIIIIVFSISNLSHPVKFWILVLMFSLCRCRLSVATFTTTAGQSTPRVMAFSPCSLSPAKNISFLTYELLATYCMIFLPTVIISS